MGNKATGALVALIVLLLGASSCLFIVAETERALLLRFGEVVKADIAPGLHVKIPFINSVKKFDARLLTVDAPAERYLTLEKKAVIVDSYAKWRITDVKSFYTAASGDVDQARRLLSQRINTGLRNQIAERTIHEVVSGQRDELMVELTKALNLITTKEFGIELVDIRVKRIDLPPEVSESVFRRMTTEREREAREHRSRGKELAEGIRAAADREKVVIESEAYRLAQTMRGEGDAVAAATYAKAYNKNPEFYAFWRSLQAYEASFASGQDMMVIKPDSEFFRYLNNPSGK
jgi:membrane protease subunit HflC